MKKLILLTVIHTFSSLAFANDEAIVNELANYLKSNCSEVMINFTSISSDGAGVKPTPYIKYDLNVRCTRGTIIQTHFFHEPSKTETGKYTFEVDEKLALTKLRADLSSSELFRILQRAIHQDAAAFIFQNDGYAFWDTAKANYHTVKISESYKNSKADLNWYQLLTE
jgi:hypothetical protein